MKTKEQLTALKEEVETLNRKLAELTEDELRLVVGGSEIEFEQKGQPGEKEIHIYENGVNKDFTPAFPTGSDN